MITANTQRSFKKKKQSLNARALAANEIAEAAAKRTKRKALQSVRDAEIEAPRKQKFEQLEMHDEVVVAPLRLSPPLPTAQNSTPTKSSSPGPPPYTMLPSISEGRAKRPRAQSGFYRALEAGNSQEVRQKKSRR